MSTSTQTFVIAGASLAGAKAAETLRTMGFDGRIVMFGAEAERPYERPELSKKYLRAEYERDRLYVHDESFYAAQQIELRTSTRIDRIDPAASEVTLADGERLHYDRLLIATGAEPRRLTLPGAELEGVHYLRTLTDADGLREQASRSSNLVVIGAGWIGSETAASARALGLEVTVIEPQSVPLERVLGKELGGFYRAVHTDHGVRMLLGTGVEAIEGEGNVERVRTSDGQTIDTDLVVVGVGVVPRTDLAERADIAVDNGIVVDEQLQSNVPGIWAAGDVANHAHPLLGERRGDERQRLGRNRSDPGADQCADDCRSESPSRRGRPARRGCVYVDTTMTTSERGPCTPSTRLSSISEVAEGPETSVIGRCPRSTRSPSSRIASGTSSTI
jgi:3-phenylpropionate/trans-cinnamate dioxygenase ferredoxin reductase component